VRRHHTKHHFEARLSGVEIYTGAFCCYCDAARELLRRKGVAFTEIDVTGDQQQRAEMYRRARGRTTLPQIFVGATHVGGCDDLYALDRAGKLDPLLGP
jgi:glutaredoxin 3